MGQILGLSKWTKEQLLKCWWGSGWQTKKGEKWRVGESVILALNTSFRQLNNPLPDEFISVSHYVKNALILILNFFYPVCWAHTKGNWSFLLNLSHLKKSLGWMLGHSVAVGVVSSISRKEKWVPLCLPKPKQWINISIFYLYSQEKRNVCQIRVTRIMNQHSDNAW